MKTAEALAARILFFGGVAAVMLMVLGLAGFVLSHGRSVADPTGSAETPDAHVVYTSVAEVLRAVNHWPVEPLAVVAVGILVMLATPVVSVVAVFAVFAGSGDRRYAAISAVLMAALLVSLLVVSGR